MQGWCWPLMPVATTLKSTPANAQLVPPGSVACFCSLTSVRRPITAEGRTTNTLPLPLFVFIALLRLPTHPPVHTPALQVCPVAQSALVEHVLSHMPKPVAGLMFAQISAPPRAAQSAAVAQVPALHVVPPVIVPLEFNTQCVVPVFPYVKLPLLCAIAMLHARRAVTPIKAMSFIYLLPSIVNVNLPGPSLIRHSSRHT